MTDSYTPPKVWTWEQPNGGRFASTNRPIAGATHEKELPVGKHPFQLYSLRHTQRGEGHGPPRGASRRRLRGAEYDAWLIRIGKGDQFGSGFVEVNPNSKIPALHGPLRPHARPRLRKRRDPPPPRREVRGVPTQDARPEMLSWLFWQMGSAPYLGGGFGHFYAYAPEKWQYPIDRYAMETKRQLDVLDRHLARERMDGGRRLHHRRHRDLAVVRATGARPALQRGRVPRREELQPRVEWAERINARPAVKRGRMVNRTSGEPHEQLLERHDASDFETRTEDKRAAAE